MCKLSAEFAFDEQQADNQTILHGDVKKPLKLFFYLLADFRRQVILINKLFWKSFFGYKIAVCGSCAENLLFLFSCLFILERKKPVLFSVCSVSAVELPRLMFYLLLLLDDHEIMIISMFSAPT